VLQPFRALGLAVGRPNIPLTEALQLAETAERAGFAMIGAGEGFFENFALMGALTQRTRAAELMTSITTWTRTPLTTALAVATLAELSGGRYRLGLGAMPRAWSERWHDVDSSRPVERMRDFIAAIRAVQDAKPGLSVDHEGPFYRVRGYEPISQRTPARVPLYLGATRPRMAELAGEVADGVAFNAIHSVPWLRDVMSPALVAGLDRAGRRRRDFDAGILLYCAIADDEARAFDLARPGLAFYFAVPYFADVLRHHGWDKELERGREALARRDVVGATREVSDDMVEAMTIAGTPRQVREKLRRYETHVDWVELVTPLENPPEVTRELTARILSTFGATTGEHAVRSGTA
jgi:alkanesulfonate monooxygenase SsuD/methylene tetrahydromethanopterin reductase-like flavin-dependent oxidoreductase (luciferase family)